MNKVIKLVDVCRQYNLGSADVDGVRISGNSLTGIYMAEGVLDLDDVELRVVEAKEASSRSGQD